ncbi:hypothetical protein DFA_09525 [Cavenderia fasciculata]|uniref:Uncharacterized protein n=1 Tax=Cavenderia fasciculata TaxID=261658 RepID=F4Q7V6_CACFS|nr:uncharacterized protein DFA_09525 [Cavenderia fasciculata]EGG15856.1 hypothetical protein DFA_09525 [Cavenderia fasciculata]|eukprot:XP_004352181.1 hypothetical protein DFA_09525 [Cavenderia fasciculata]
MSMEISSGSVLVGGRGVEKQRNSTGKSYKRSSSLKQQQQKKRLISTMYLTSTLELNMNSILIDQNDGQRFCSRNSCFFSSLSLILKVQVQSKGSKRVFYRQEGHNIHY